MSTVDRESIQLVNDVEILRPGIYPEKSVEGKILYLVKLKNGQVIDSLKKYENELEIYYEYNGYKGVDPGCLKGLSTDDYPYDLRLYLANRDEYRITYVTLYKVDERLIIDISIIIDLRNWTDNSNPIYLPRKLHARLTMNGVRLYQCDETPALDAADGTLCVEAKMNVPKTNDLGSKIFTMIEVFDDAYDQAKQSLISSRRLSVMEYFNYLLSQRYFGVINTVPVKVVLGIFMALAVARGGLSLISDLMEVFGL